MGENILITAGGTGGHLFPAFALAAELERRGYEVDLATDERADKYGERFPGRAVHVIQSETVRGRNPVALFRTAVRLGRGTLQALSLIRRKRPRAIIGFGGYPTFPPMFAGFLSGVPTILHEANAVMGRANRMLAGRVKVIALGLLGGSGSSLAPEKTVITGNPVRPQVLDAMGKPYAAPEAGEDFRLLIFGGSQGARFFSEMVPEALGMLDEAHRSRLALTMQARAEDLESVREQLSKIGIKAELAPFFTDMAERIADAHLVVCRSGAMSVTELGVIGRPAILVPFPHALDQDQALNAAVLEEAGGAWPIAQAELSPARFAETLAGLMDEPERLAKAAEAARSAGEPGAVTRLADLVEHVSNGGSAKDFDKGDVS
ncbi:undecaprenyldiphospho-muramoylpentapeptide beta-N-acetylglucosaminyltransferase [Stappia sp. GBMRC 2046]|uniref:UDP-N-acetylglucosamine--N-acetylmuramyl-(pentapeptide) pyrophosphoryl-undecaprenol N-acetylglucosamine transferase n=1 Tax=Stappia sediminis TaxID=2692190 RepID=A0A7X3LR15_9HYPH|nr:undecaprenyldiphospho-muramoylpentapeptide beta-N-acetylglucosaminyltransferase [Stappia sediminis]MXN63518.1 undecaprenyldiphospho-muramoylpentapeptide beta-N-acetylglucosaminyltransferase [Stappia sediminis]